MIIRTLIISVILFAFWACSSSIDTINLGPEERLQYAISLFEDEDFQEAATEFEALLLQYPGSVIVDDAQYYLGLCRFERDEYILAAYEFSKLIKNMPASEFVSKSQFMLAETFYELSPNYNLDQKYTKKAIEEYQAFIDFFPLNEKVSEAEQKIGELNDKLAQKEYDTAVIYEKMDYYTAAMKYYDGIVELYHDTKYAPQAMYRKIQLLMEREREDEALAEMKKFIKQYPEDENFNKVEELKNSLESKLRGSFSSN
ncbi:MAG: outer membrane protein assembly factor BamD [Ignavibacteria bacterium]|nr:outer membrane protein assembly factor BamD [Ignavibacteria bacterium]MBT8382440.1 outer membrane protein assembly factor BamD [Ignavibacteria bacterium]MBT8392817.1 outer membrane protein assembly factor BamD [Ignavibacteria bacterium]NNJ53595.1 outer membrane protein assembly factor BamD [Ignavibacteriaceae bacterium]NNL20202.1 outer membrane protein assembly factor BamD [Ignavibacteriaceae bacterium]